MIILEKTIVTFANWARLIATLNLWSRSKALKILNPNFEVLEKNMAGVEAKPLKKVNKPYKIRREGSFVSGFR